MEQKRRKCEPMKEDKLKMWTWRKKTKNFSFLCL